jgi:hypothetical protein
VAGHGPVGDVGGAFADVDHARYAAGVLGGLTGPALGPAGAQAAGQFPAEFASALHVDAAVDRLMGHPHHRIVGELGPQAAGDLLR